MRAGEKSGSRRRRAVVFALAAALVAVAGMTGAADAKKKKKAKPAAITRTAAVPLSAGQTQTATASCPKGRHVAGGGLSVAPAYVPSPSSGLRSLAGTSRSVGTKSWTASSTAFTNPVASGTLTSFARCERDRLGTLSSTLTSQATLNPGFGTSGTLTCAPGSHVVSGGYEGSAASAPNALFGYRLVVLQSQRTSARGWTVSLYNNGLTPPSGVPITVTIYALCELDRKGQSVSERASAPTALVLNTRSSAQATCAKKKHAISGGFVVTPNASGNVPSVGLDEFTPIGNRGWYVGLHPWQSVSLPPGSALQAFAYCKNGK